MNRPCTFNQLAQPTNWRTVVFAVVCLPFCVGLTLGLIILTGPYSMDRESSEVPVVGLSLNELALLSAPSSIDKAG